MFYDELSPLSQRDHQLFLRICTTTHWSLSACKISKGSVKESSSNLTHKISRNNNNNNNNNNNQNDYNRSPSRRLGDLNIAAGSDGGLQAAHESGI